MDKDFFFHLSLVGIGFIMFQILGFGMAGYGLGFVLLGALGGVLIWLVGYINKCGMAARNGGYIEPSQITIAYAPSIVFGSLAVIAIAIGVYVWQ